jgi:hypothetical protein
MEIYIPNIKEILIPDRDKDQFTHIEGDTFNVKKIGQVVPISRFVYDSILTNFQNAGFNIDAPYEFTGEGSAVQMTPREYVEMYLVARSMAGIED